MSKESAAKITGAVDQARLLLTSPTEFYQGMARIGGYGSPILFIFVMGVSAGLIQIISQFFGLGQFGRIAATANGWTAFLELPLVMIVGCTIASIIAFSIWRLIGSSESFETSFRCIAYSAAIAPVAAVLSIIPYLGTLGYVTWAISLIYLASIEVHSIRPATAKLVLGVLGFLLCMSSVMSEYTARRFHEFSDFGRPQAIQSDNSASRKIDVNHKTPEEIGKVVADFLKGLEDATKKDSPEDSAR